MESFFVEWLGIEKHIEQFGNWLKKKISNDNSLFVNGFVLSSLTISVGAMTVIGTLQDDIMDYYSTLMTKGVIDMVIIMIMTTSLGKGCIFTIVKVDFIRKGIL